MIIKKDKSLKGLSKSYWKDNIRIRMLTRRMEDRWMKIGLKNYKGWFYTEIFTLEQAIERDINFRKNWRSPKKNTEKVWFSENIYTQKDDWILVEDGPLDENWVMLCLWRNINKSLPYARFPNGNFGIESNKKLHAYDRLHQDRISDKLAYDNNQKIGTKTLLVIEFLARLIVEKGFYDKYLVEMAYMKVYKTRPPLIRVGAIMRSNKLMEKLAERLKELLGKCDIETDWVFKQLKEMGESNYDADPKRRLEVVKLVGRLNGIVLDQDKRLLGESTNIDDIEVQNDLKLIAEQ